MLITLVKLIFEIFKRRKEDITILILNDEEIENLNLSVLDQEPKKEFDIYMGKEKIN